ncbi:hypothetical protein PO909_025934 [Leuciscus waleckii]
MPNWGQPFTIGEKLVLPAIKEVISTVMERDPTQVLKSIPLSNDTVARRINEMGADTEEQLHAILRDETTTADNNALLMAYVLYRASNSHKMAEEFLFSKYLETDTKGQTIFNTLSAYLQEKSIPISNILACATDGAPSMVGRYRGFTPLLKEKVSEALTDDLLLVYTDHLSMVKADMEIRFRDLLNLDVPSWAVQPFQTDVIECEPAIQEHLVDIQCDNETSGWCSMWVKYAQRYPALWQKIRLLILVFPTTYLVEQGFSQVIHMQSKYRNRLDLLASDALRLNVSATRSKEISRKTSSTGLTLIFKSILKVRIRKFK